MTKCPYRADKECIGNIEYKEYPCNWCLLGQQADELSLLNSAIANMTASIEERLCREEQK